QLTPRAAARRVRESVAARVAASMDDEAASAPKVDLGLAAIHAAKNKPLTESEERFAHHCVLLRNATLAYEAVYDCTGMRRQSVYGAASRLRNQPHVTRRIQELQRSAAQATVIDVSKMLMDDFELVEASQQG